MQELDDLLEGVGLDKIDNMFDIPIVFQGERGEKGDKGDIGLSVKGDCGMDGMDGMCGMDGRDGIDGVGINGKDGRDGIDGISIATAIVNAKGELIIRKSDGERINAGIVKGEDGVSVGRIEINEEGELLVEKSNGEILNLGIIKGKDGNSSQWAGNAYTALKELEDVAISSPTNGQVLSYNSTTRKWRNAAGGAGGSSAFNDITAGINITAAMVVGTGASLATSGSGTIAATTVVTNANSTGDVTSVGNTTTIANDAVTYAKIQNVTATDKILGRSTAGAGDVEEITFTAAARALCDDTTASAQRTTLGMQDYITAHSTGIKTGGVLSIGTPTTKFTISDGTGVVVDNTSATPTITEVSWTGKTNLTPTYLLTNLVSYIAIDNTGAVIQSTTPFTNTQHRDYIVLGSLIHVNLTNLDAVNQFGEIAISPANQLSDLSEALGIFNRTGNAYSANGANLNINKSAGTAHSQGSNWANDTKNPNVVTLASLTALSFQYRFSTGTNGATGTAINPAIYDVAGVSTAVPANKFTVQRIYSFVSNNVKIQPGQAVYNSLAEAKASIQTEVFVTETSIANNGLLRGFLVVRESTTALNDASFAFFLEAGKFGSSTGVGGQSVSTMQNTYDNSTAPQITTTTTLGAVTHRRGSAADTDVVYRIQNAAAATTFSVTGEGKVSAGIWNGTIITSAYGGTGNGFTKFTGATTSERTFTLPDANATLKYAGTETLWIPAGAIRPSVTGGCAPPIHIVTAANQPDIQYNAFDTTTQEYGQFAIAFPKSWNEGTITAVFYWSHAATTTNFGVVWNLQGVAQSDTDAIAAAYGTAQQIADTGGTTDVLYVTSATPAITIAGTPAVGDLVNFRVSRVTADGSDTMAIDARLMGVKILFTTDAGNDD